MRSVNLQLMFSRRRNRKGDAATRRDVTPRPHGNDGEGNMSAAGVIGDRLKLLRGEGGGEEPGADREAADPVAAGHAAKLRELKDVLPAGLGDALTQVLFRLGSVQATLR